MLFNVLLDAYVVPLFRLLVVYMDTRPIYKCTNISDSKSHIYPLSYRTISLCQYIETNLESRLKFIPHWTKL